MRYKNILPRGVRIIKKLFALAFILGVSINLPIAYASYNNRPDLKVFENTHKCSNCNLSGVTLKLFYVLALLDHANLSYVDAEFCNFSFSNFQYANLTGASFKWADLKKADFTGAILKGADFHGANLTGAKGFVADEVADVCMATLPDGKTIYC